MKQAIQDLLKKGILISPDMVDEEADHSKVDSDSDILQKVKEKIQEQRSEETNEAKERKPEIKNEEKTEEFKHNIEVIDFFNENPHKYTVQDFVSHFNRRYEAIQNMLKSRQELSMLSSISRVLTKAEKEKTSIIGTVTEKSTTKNGNIILKLEDPSGEISVLVSKNKQDMMNIAKDIQLDEIFGVNGVTGNRILFANKIVFPDIPLTREIKKSPKEEYVVILGDIHVGVNLFLEKDFEKFLEWINGESGTEEQKRIAKLTKYVIVPGDLVEGVGVYPNQDKDLNILDLKEQYEVFVNYLKRIPKHMEILCIPGNHDVGRLAEPQLDFVDDYSKIIRELPNVVVATNPAWIRLGKQPGFEGFDILLYHGYSLIFISDNVSSIREAGGQKRVDLVMKYMLQRRHLAPTHTSNLYVPYLDKDPMVIDRIPDFFITGHIHRVSVSQYRSVTNINGSCWSDISENQEKRGLEPQPARVPVINLQTREVKILNFFKKG